MNREKLEKEIVEKGHVIRVSMNAEAVHVTFADRHGENVLFVHSAWLLLKHGVPNGEPITAAFFGKYRSVPGLVGPYGNIDLRLAFGEHIGFSADVDGHALQQPTIRRLGFFADTDIGVILVSFQPTLAEDARPLVMLHIQKKRWRIAAQHLAAAWLHEIWGLAE